MVKKVVSGIIFYNNRVILTQRIEEKYDDLWEFPGGKIEEGETPQEALIREIKEELDLDIVVNRKFINVKYDYPTFFIDMDCYLCELKGDIKDLKLNVHKSYTLLPVNNIPDEMLMPADVLINKELKNSKFCFQCEFVCKKDKVCRNFKYGIRDYQVCFYDNFGDGVPTCFDESFYSSNDPEQAASALSYVGAPGVRVFVNYHDNSFKELLIVDCEQSEASYLDGTNSLNKHDKNYKQKHDKVLKAMKDDEERRREMLD